MRLCVCVIFFLCVAFFLFTPYYFGGGKLTATPVICIYVYMCVECV